MAERRRSPKTSGCLRAAIYARVSSKQQADSNTIASQLEALKARLQADGSRLEPELCFTDEGYSGSTLVRPALERLRDQAAAGSFDRLYVHSPDRLSRRYAYQVLLVDELQRQGIQIVFLNHDIGQSPEENLLLQVQGVVAKYERAKMLERSRRGKRHAAKEGTVNVLCGGTVRLPLHRQVRRRWPSALRGERSSSRSRATDVRLGCARSLLHRRSVPPAAGPRDSQPARQGLLGSDHGMEHPQESGVRRPSPVR